MPNISTIKIRNYNYKVDLNKPYDLSIPIDTIKSPSFYDDNPVKVNYYTNKNKVWSIEKGAPCNIPVITLNIHCGVTHTECRSHITKEKIAVTDCIDNSLSPSYLISVEPRNNIKKDTYHHTIERNDLIITKDMLYQKLENIDEQFLKSIIIRTLPNSNTALSKNYNTHNNPYFSNEATYYLESLGTENLIVDLPSIDKYDDGGKLGNHQIFWNIDKESNNNTITELAYITEEVEDGKYLLSLNMLNLKLDASPSRPIIYKVLK